MQSSLNEGIAVQNAGLVILNGYLPMLFDRRGITNEKRFTDAQAQCDAVVYLQYLATGTAVADEVLLPLNKVLCGIPLASSVPLDLPIQERQSELMEGLLLAAISHWPVIGASTTTGFRGNWLLRDGLLIEQDDKWELMVEQRSYDLLLRSAPFAFSIIKYPWMTKPLYVLWPH